MGSRVSSKVVLLVRMYWECLKKFVSTPWFSRYFSTAEDKYDNAVRGASALPTVKDVMRTVMQASGNVIVEYWNRSV
jgi:hypothetical protein